MQARETVASASIPFNRPYLTGREREYLEEALQSRQFAGDGPSALETAALLCDLAPGDEIIMPSYTFVSTANAFWLRQAKVKFVDIRRDTLNIDETQIEAAIGARTRAIAPVHYAGVGCEMD